MLNKLTLLIVVSLIGMFFCPCVGNGYLQVKDEGVIEAIVDENIVVLGFLGTHVLELLGVCSWCEVGSSVAVRFISLTRAELIDTETRISKPPVQTLIIRDGRGDE
jgi:hypothetical protein